MEHNHELIKKLSFFITKKCIPNIIFHGPSGCGKRTLLKQFLINIYGDQSTVNSNVMMVNCSHGKGIKFIREELKFFAKANIHSSHMFKSIVLLNADSLTIDAQSALRRCIELFCHKTRFFIVIDNKHKLLNPIISRFCEIHVSEKYIKDKFVNLHKLPLLHDTLFHELENEKILSLKKELKHLETLSLNKKVTLSILTLFSESLYEKGFSAKNIIDHLPTLELQCIDNDIIDIDIITLCYHKLKPDFRNESMLIFYILKMLYLSSNATIKNMLLV